MLFKMETTITVILSFVCIVHVAEISAKTNTAGTDVDSSLLNSDFNELSANELSNEIDNCHEACLQKVSFYTLFNRKTYLRSTKNKKGGFHYMNQNNLFNFRKNDAFF